MIILLYQQLTFQRCHQVFDKDSGKMKDTVPDAAFRVNDRTLLLNTWLLTTAHSIWSTLTVPLVMHLIALADQLTHS
jgi:hypothetical protein